MFVRTVLALSLSCMFAGTALAATTAEQPLNPQLISDTAVEDPIDPLATDASAAVVPSEVETQITQQEEQDLNKASATCSMASIRFFTSRADFSQASYSA